jgi:hypothetical protein
LIDFAAPAAEFMSRDRQKVNGVELVFLPSHEAGRSFGVTDLDDLAWMADRLTGHPWKCLEQPLRLTNEKALSAIPRYHILRASAPAARDLDRTAKARAEGRIWVIDSGHDLMITEPEAVTEVLVDIARV